MTDLPMPGDEFMGRTVIASCYFTDDVWGFLFLDKSGGYGHYVVVEMDAPLEGGTSGVVTVATGYNNIVPAAIAYHEDFGAWAEFGTGWQNTVDRIMEEGS